MESITGSGPNINVTWSPDGNTIAFGNRDDVVSFVDFRKRKVRAKQLPGGREGVWPSGQHLMPLFVPHRQCQIMKTQKYSYEINEISWSNCGTAFFLTTGSGTIEILQYPNLENLRTLKVLRVLNGSLCLPGPPD